MTITVSNTYITHFKPLIVKRLKNLHKLLCVNLVFISLIIEYWGLKNSKNIVDAFKIRGFRIKRVLHKRLTYLNAPNRNKKAQYALTTKSWKYEFTHTLSVTRVDIVDLVNFLHLYNGLGDAKLYSVKAKLVILCSWYYKNVRRCPRCLIGSF